MRKECHWFRLKQGAALALHLGRRIGCVDALAAPIKFDGGLFIFWIETGRGWFMMRVPMVRGVA